MMEEGRSDCFQGNVGFLEAAVIPADHLVTELMFLEHYDVGDCCQILFFLPSKALYVTFLCNPIRSFTTWELLMKQASKLRCMLGKETIL